VKEERTLDLEDRLYDVAMGAAPDATGVMVLAGRSLHAIWNGQPVATNVNLTADDIGNLSDAELDAELEAVERAAAETATGSAPKGVPK
jgi:hypothetical protein